MIVITAPTSQIGSKVVDALVKTDEPLRLIVRDATRFGSAVRERVEIIEGSHGDASVVDRGFEGADAVFWLAPPPWKQTLKQAYVDFSGPAATAIRRHNVARVLSITALGRRTAWQDRAGAVTASIEMDNLLMETGAAFRALAMPSFMENTARQAAVMKDKGMFFGPIRGDQKLRFTATSDMAAAAVRFLSDPSWTGQKEAPVLGPEDLSFDDQAAIISEVTGRPMRYQQISYEQFKQQFLDRGTSESVAQGYVDMYRAKDEGIDNVAEGTSKNTGSTSFRAFCERYLRPILAA
ncbi:NAD(P)H-binding protein [Agrobacterium sp. V1]|uniref:NmrA family NAD(P)-binding protein n=1 Tax=Agrobacterium sp. V1 TaxID=3061957 RepID=UPI002673619C|nr:NAD(P)H-binding protein [Agrobacterium sp. V1]MDO3445418.1 NAD(P)H-binding protein [Agrobacterium sp. V1]